MKVGRIYKITNTINGMSYVGQTTKSIEHRLYGHIADVKRNCKMSIKLRKAMKEDGFENFIIESLEEVIEDMLDEREQYWIAKLNTMNTGYNSTSGGIKNFKMSEELRQRMVEQNQWKAVKVDVYKKDGTFIKTCDSFAQAGIEFNIHPSSVSNIATCRGRHKSNHGYRFAIHGEELPPLKKPKKIKVKPPKIEGYYKRGGVNIQQMDEDENVINTFTSMIEAGNQTGFQPQGISQCCRGVMKRYKGYKWRYAK